MRIGVDGMGGDYAPRVVINGAIEAANEYGLDIVVVGPQDVLGRELARHKKVPKNIEIIHASEVIGMDGILILLKHNPWVIFYSLII